MQASTPRDPTEALRPQRKGRGMPLRFRTALPGVAFRDVLGPRALGGRLRAVRRLTLCVLWTLVAIPVQAVLLLLPGRAKIRFARLYWRGMQILFGLRVSVVGAAPAGPRSLYLANHSSWLDILVLGGTLEACFVAKAEVGRWPMIGIVAKLGRTVFVSRARGRTGSEAVEMRERLEAGDSLILFPEGTSSDGTRVLPFRSSFLAVANAAAMVQPISVGYDQLGYLPTGRRERPLFAWYGDMDIGSHAWRLARHAGAHVTVVVHEAVSPAEVPDRKTLSAAAQTVVATGAATLRQNRRPEALALRLPTGRARPQRGADSPAD
ncbi:1-acyl-sn-glycerol-3-phosphate acyltransferase [Roseomonas sp. OT10]|uniref:lysophospholipid acyltransferase family protein n=1 Tax=Roseomonas cutis TaxID=2897332 RepID=UPI001E40CA7F|nr:lysophospholipid acyltransferase family protein [Roseomonas sp. OT10]UFN51297.1 1-acyl-sn-glycerol-3-phosphate acyltransferase [Roseomonas sp. OT10]